MAGAALDSAEGLAVLTVPDTLGLRADPLVAVLAGQGQVVVAGRDLKSALPVLAVLSAQEDGARRIWPAATPMPARTDAGNKQDGPDQPDLLCPAAELAVLPGGQIMALLADGPCLVMDRSLTRVRKLPRPRPESLVPIEGGGALAVLRAKDGRVTLAAPAAADDPARAGWTMSQAAQRPGPPMGPDQRLRLAFAAIDGTLILAVEDRIEGFRLWRETKSDQGGDPWQAIGQPGAGRFGMNARPLCTAFWQGRRHLGVGRDPGLWRDIPGIALAGELLTVDTETGAAALVAGEVRIGPARLMAPSLSMAHDLNRLRVAGALSFGSLAPLGRSLAMHLQDPLRGLNAIRVLDPDGRMTAPKLSGAPAALLAQPDGAVAVVFARGREAGQAV